MRCRRAALPTCDASVIRSELALGFFAPCDGRQEAANACPEDIEHDGDVPNGERPARHAGEETTADGEGDENERNENVDRDANVVRLGAAVASTQDDFGEAYAPKAPPADEERAEVDEIDHRIGGTEGQKGVTQDHDRRVHRALREHEARQELEDTKGNAYGDDFGASDGSGARAGGTGRGS